MNRAFAACICLLLLTSAALAEVEVTIYGGFQSVPESNIVIRDADVIADADFSEDWQGQSSSAPLYYGIRATSWWSPTFGLGVDLAHSKLSPKDDDLPAGYDLIESTDGVNTMTVNAYRRWLNRFGEVTPYIGGGVGLAAPHVEVTNVASETFGYQLTGPAATWVAGARYPINEQVSVFGEYRGTYSANVADLSTGETLETDVTTNALNLGLSFNF
ncbi:outer membrane protein [Yoonia sediminilitoris]|uniref:Lipid A oxidase n=1 Tax=Yoonia sediminilitoris TaxID=1286148 RepID=A0A2T6KH62_9RHOB|nr:outer membrane beta-barrel protein [Yoonia sediminilitoris]PUB14856.1 lipid A oxidase [Yoonia sediminilitoris]RCW95573.1 lipid A oxidase [Yoonia sediminilitoris]